MFHGQHLVQQLIRIGHLQQPDYELTLARKKNITVPVSMQNRIFKVEETGGKARTMTSRVKKLQIQEIHLLFKFVSCEQYGNIELQKA